MQTTNRISRNVRIDVALVTLLLVASMIGGACAKKATPHPNQLNSFDGQAYDRLTEAQAVLTEAKAQYAQGKLPVSAKPVINDAGAVYNTTYTAWLTYRDVVSGKTAGDQQAAQQQLLNSMTQLAQAIVNLKALFGGK